MGSERSLRERAQALVDKVERGLLDATEAMDSLTGMMLQDENEDVRVAGQALVYILYQQE